MSDIDPTEAPDDAPHDDATVVERKSARPKRSGPAPRDAAGREERASLPSSADLGGDDASEEGSSINGARRGGAVSLDQTGDRDEVDAIMVREEATRAQAFAMLSLLMGGFVLACLPLLPGNPYAKLACAIGLAAICATSLWTRRQLSIPDCEVQRVLRIYGWVICTGVLGAEVYLGFFSPIVVVISLGIHYMSMTQDARTRVALPTFVIGAWLVGAIGVSAGVVPDVGIVRIDASHPPMVRAFLLLAVAMTLGIAWWTSRRARASLEEAVRSAREAIVQVNNREALLAEAKNQLDRAMRLSVGQPGRYTGQLAGEQRLDVLVGFGAMGEVYAAEGPAGTSRSAVKLLRPEALRDDKLVERFLREAEICSQLRHPNVVQVQRVGKLATGAPFMTMELLQGRDLAATLRKLDRLPWQDVVGLARALGGALDHAHATGIIHRDLKPHNVFLTRVPDGQPSWKVLDFGISKVMAQSGTLTQDGIVGTPGYMSPEQATGGTVDARSDVFAMAAVLYRAATGRPAFPGKDTPTIMFDVVFRMPERPSAAHPEVPKLLDQVLLVGLAKSPQDRFASAGALANAIESIGDGRLPVEVRRMARRAHTRHPWGGTLGTAGTDAAL